MSCVTESHSDGWRWSRISTKIHYNFLSKSIFGASSVSARLWDAAAGSRITAGPLLTFGDGMTIDTGRPPSTAAISTPFLNGSSEIPYCTVVTKNEVQAPHPAQGAAEHKKNHPQHPPDQNFRFFILAKTFE